VEFERSGLQACELLHRERSELEVIRLQRGLSIAGANNKKRINFVIDLVRLADTTEHGREVVTAPDGGFRVTLTFGREA
jgi:hypothetical protein